MADQSGYTLLFLGVTAQAALIDGLEAYWNFDGENFLDSVGIYDGTPQGTVPITFVDGLPGFGKAIKLNGEDQEILITGGEPDDLAFAGGSMSVSGWFKVDAFDTAWQALIAKGEGTNWRVHRRDQTGNLTCSMGIGEVGTAGGPPVNDGQWHHFVAIADASTFMYLYIDGVLAEQTTGAPVLASNGQRVRIAENPDALGREWEGELDDLAIWSRALTPEEVTLLSGNPLSALLAGAARPSIRIAANAIGITVTMTDAPGAVVDTTPIVVTLDGNPIATTQAKVGNVTTLTYSSLPSFLPSGAHTLGIQAQVNGAPFNEPIPFTIAGYVELNPSWMAPAGSYDTSSPGHKGYANQIAVGRSPGDANNVWNAFRQLAGGYIDPATGNAYENLVDSAGGFGGVDANGNFEMPDPNVYLDPWININQNYAEPTGQIGSFQSPNFPDNPIPGIPGKPVPPATEGGTDNFVLESYTYLQFNEAPKLYRLAVNSDDGFHVAWGPNMRSALFTAPTGASASSNAGMYNGGKGQSDVVFDVAVPVGGAGVYLTRLVYWEGGDLASCEFFQVLDNGTKVLIGDTANGSMAAYKASGAGQSLPADVVSAAPWPGQVDVNPENVQVQIIIADGTTATVDVNSITLTVNGAEPPKTTVRVGNKVRVTASLTGLLPRNRVVPVSFQYTAGGEVKTGSYSFTTIDYPTLPPALGTDIGTGATAGMRWRTHQLAAGTTRGNSIVDAEAQLAGNLGASIHNTAGQGADGFFPIDFVNYDQAAGVAGNFNVNAAAPQNVADVVIPGAVNADPDYVASETLAYLELQPGFYQMVVNSDDGFEVTTGNATQPKYLSLGLFDAGRAYADTVFYFGVEKAGVYLFRLLWFEGTGGAGVEWFTVNPNGSRALVNGTQTGAIRSFRTRTVAEPELPVGGEASFNPPTISNGQVNLSWEGTGTLQESTDLVNWTNSASQANPQTITPEGTFKAYRISTP
jgi:hypothetical protein